MFKKIIISGLVVAIAFSSCKKDGTNASATTKASVHAQMRTVDEMAAISDADIFRSVMFIDGPAADLVGDFQDLNITALTDNQEKIEQVRASHEELLERIVSDNPEYLAGFRANVTSGDYEKVKSAIFGASDLIFRTTAEIHNVSQEELASYGSSVADKFKSKYNLEYQSSKNDFVRSMKAELQPGATLNPCTDALFLMCGIITSTNIVVDNVVAVFVVKASYQGEFSSYEAERFVSTVAINFGQN